MSSQLHLLQVRMYVKRIRPTLQLRVVYVKSALNTYTSVIWNTGRARHTLQLQCNCESATFIPKTLDTWTPVLVTNILATLNTGTHNLILCMRQITQLS